ncbi:MAG: hypothetical protein IPM57_03980 [Oligoflexia bacterium]|nr:hypothetical protein [Oligoflexia bacterium]
MFGLHLILIVISSITRAETVTSRMPVEQIHNIIALRMNIKVSPQIPLPKVVYSSQIPFEEYLNLVRANFGKYPLPSGFVNMYSSIHNMIFLIDDAKIYKLHPIEVTSRIQYWFEENYLLKGRSI